MNVYVESNFVLELAFLQEQSDSCRQLVRHAADRNIVLVVPAYSLAEPYETLIRQRKRRKQVKQDIDDVLTQLHRTSAYTADVRELSGQSNLLISSAHDEQRRLENVIREMAEVAEIVPLDVNVIAVSLRCQSDYGLEPQDAFVYASVVSHLDRSGPAMQSCFLNRNRKDFDDQTLVEQLEVRGCKLLTDFRNGLGFVRSQLTE